MILFKNATLLTMEDEKPYTGDILIDGDRISRVGESVSSHAAIRYVGSDERINEIGNNVDGTDDRVIDATGLYIMPGIIDAHCHIGLYEDGQSEDEGDGNEISEPVTPQLRAIDAVNPFDNAFNEARENGITVAVTGPGSANVLGGQFIAVKTVGKCVDDMVVKNPVAVKAALGENPKRVYAEKDKTPVSRMAIASVLRETLYEALDYKNKLEKEDGDKPDVDLKLQALIPVLNKEIPLKIHAHRADDILTAIRIAKEFDIDYTIDHCTQGHLIGEYLTDKKVILGPLTVDRCKTELQHLSIKAPKILKDHGVEFAIATDHPVIPIQYLPISAALAAREGLDTYEALKAITINPAKIIGLDKEMGSLKAGKVANIAVFDKHPLDVMARTKYVLIDGNVVFERD